MSRPAAPTAPSRGPLDPRTTGRLLVLTAGVAFSVGGPLVRLVESATQWQFLAYRSGAVAAVVLVYLLWRGEVLRTLRAAGLDAVVGGIGLGGAFAGFIFSITHTTVANTLLLLSTAPLWAAVLGWLVLRERVPGVAWLAIAGGLAGIAVMASDNIALGNVFGDVTALGAAAGFAVFSVALRRGRATDMMPAVLCAGLFTAIVSAIAATAEGTGIAVSPRDATIAIGYGVIALGAGFGLFTLGSRHVPAVELTVLSMTEVVLGPVWMWLGFDEVPALRTFVGGAIVLVAVVSLALAAKPEEAAAPGSKPPTRLRLRS